MITDVEVDARVARVSPGGVVSTEVKNVGANSGGGPGGVTSGS